MGLICWSVSFGLWNGSRFLGVTNDSRYYVRVAEQIRSMVCPDLLTRTPIYPIYWLIFGGENLIWANMVVGAIGGILLLWLTDKIWGENWWSFWITIISFADYGVISFQNTLLTESIAPTLMLLFLVVNLVVIKKKKLIWLVVVVDFLIMYLKPSFFLLPLILTLFLGWKKRKMLVLLIVLEMLMLPTYNYLLAGKLTVSETGTVNNLGVVRMLGWLDSSKKYGDATDETKKLLAIYKKNGPTDDSWRMMDWINQAGIRTADIKYFYYKNWQNYLVTMPKIIINNWMTARDFYVEKGSSWLMWLDIFYKVVNKLKIIGFLVAMGWWIRKRSLYLGSVLLVIGYLILVISMFSDSEIARLRMPVDWLSNLLVCLIPVYLWQFVKIGYDKFHRR